MSDAPLYAAASLPPGGLATAAAALLAGAALPGARARLVHLSLVGERAPLLGRWQRAASAVAPSARERAARRLGGGRMVAAGDGVDVLLLALPRPDLGWSGPVPAGRVINRHVRPLLRALARVTGRPVRYYDRDTITTADGAIAVVAHDARPEGATVLEVGIARAASLAPPTGWDGYPRHGDPRVADAKWTTVSALARRPIAPEDLGAAIAEAWGAEPAAPLAADADEPAPPVREDETGWRTSGVADAPIGFVEALVRIDGERVAGARIRGDFIAPGFAVHGLEQAFVGCALDRHALAETARGVFAGPGAYLLGVADPLLFADAVLAAAQERS